MNRVCIVILPVLITLLCFKDASGQLFSDVTTVGVNGGGSVAAPCSEILAFNHYNDSIAGSSSGQNFVFILGNSDSLFFNLKRTGGNTLAVPAAPFTGGAFGNYGYLGTSGDVVLYQVNSGTTTTLLFDSILLKDRLGNQVSNYTFLVYDGESTTEGEAMQMSAPLGYHWYYWDSVAPVGQSYNTPAQAGLGTTTVEWNGGTLESVYNLCWATAVNSPPGFSVALIHTSTGREGAIIGIQRTILALNDTVCGNGNITIEPINAPLGTTYTWDSPVVNPLGSTIGATAQNTLVTNIDQSLTYVGPGVSTVTYTITPNACGIIDSPFTATVILGVGNTSHILPGNDTTYCAPFNRVLSTNLANTLWSTNEVGPQITVNHPGVFWAQTNSVCGNTRDSVVIVQSAPPELGFTSLITDCPDDTITLRPITTGYNFLWSTGDSTQSILVTQPGIYNVEAWNNIACPAYASANVTAAGAPVISLGGDTSICGNATVLLSLHVPKAHYLWQDNSVDSFYQVTVSGTYSVTVSNNCGVTTAQKTINIYPNDCSLLIPSAFSPNGDGKNDVFRALSYCPVKQFSLKVYNRWGQLIFETTDIGSGWDGIYNGIAQPLGVYVYYATYFNFCTRALESKSGNLTLLR